MALKNKKKSKQHIKNIKQSLLLYYKNGGINGMQNKKVPSERKEKIRNSLINRSYEELGREPVSCKTRLLMSKSQSGKNNPAWIDGRAFEKYGVEFDKMIKEKIRKRDNYYCQQCFRHQDELFTKNGKKYKLCIHHIDYNKKNNRLSNLISLCRSCHSKTNFKRKEWLKHFQIVE